MTGTPYRLLSLPPDLVGSFHSITDLNAPEWYCTSDPAGVKIGSGGGTAWLVDSWLKDTRGVEDHHSCRRTEPASAGLCSGG